MRNSIISFLLILLSLPAVAAINGKWINHSAIDIDSSLRATAGFNHVIKMYETESKVYVLAFGIAHYTTDAAMTAVRPIAAVIDKSTQTMVPLNRECNMSGNIIADMVYSPASGVLAIIYDNKKMDFIHDSGDVIPSDGLTRVVLPGGMDAHSISFDLSGETVYVATEFGFAVFDVKSGALKDIVNLSLPVKYANKVGENYVIYTDGALYFCNSSVNPHSIEDFTKFESTAVETYGVAGIYPVDNDVFLFPAIRESNRGTLYLNAMNLSEGLENPVAFNLVTETLHASNMAITDAFILADYLEGLVIPTKEGLVLSSQTNFVKVPYLAEACDYTSATSAKPFISGSIVKVAKNTANAVAPAYGAERYQRATTADGENFWIYRPRQGFICRNAELDGKTWKWTDASPIIEPDMSAAMKAGYMVYSPEYGVLARNIGGLYDNSDFPQSQYLADGFCSFKDGKWSRLSVFHLAYNISGKRPLNWVPRGIVIDPLAPDQVYTVSVNQGMLRSDITDPTGNLLMSSSGDNNKTVPQFVEVFPNRVSPKAGIHIPTFDKNGVMWLVPYCYPGNLGHEEHTELWYWLPEDRLAVKEPADYAAHPFKQIYIPGFYSRYDGQTFALTEPGYENIIILCSNKDNRPSFAFDHNGTFEDTSDDRVTTFENLIYESGDQFPDLFITTTAFQDPYDHKILLGTRRGVVEIDNKTLFSEKTIADWMIPDETLTQESAPRVVGIEGVSTIFADPFGRKWIATEKEGIYCLSADRRQILGHFTMDNSPLPSNRCMSAVYNPERQSIMIGTDAGIFEFFPDGADMGAAEISVEPAVMPVAIHPDYSGYVVFSGLSDAKEYKLIGPSEELIGTLRPTDGKIHWHPADSVDRLPAGTYQLEGFPSTKFMML